MANARKGTQHDSVICNGRICRFGFTFPTRTAKRPRQCLHAALASAHVAECASVPHNRRKLVRPSARLSSACSRTSGKASHTCSLRRTRPGRRTKSGARRTTCWPGATNRRLKERMLPSSSALRPSQHRPHVHSLQAKPMASLVPCLPQSCRKTFCGPSSDRKISRTS